MCKGMQHGYMPAWASAAMLPVPGLVSRMLLHPKYTLNTLNQNEQTLNPKYRESL